MTKQNQKSGQEQILFPTVEMIWGELVFIRVWFLSVYPKWKVAEPREKVGVIMGIQTQIASSAWNDPAK